MPPRELPVPVRADRPAPGRRWGNFLTACALLLAASGAEAQTYPSHPLQLVVPFAPTGSTNIIIRSATPRASELLGQPIVVMNRPGGAATIGMSVVAKSPPDGYTLGVATLSFAANPPFMGSKMPFDAERDFTPVLQVARLPMVLTVNPGVPARSVKELIELARAKPGELNYGSAGIASSGHLGGALFESLARVRMTHVPFSNTGSAAALVAGQTQLQIAPIPSSLSFIKTGQLIALGVTTRSRDSVLPGVPAIAEDLPGYEVTEWAGIVAPAKTPREIVGRLQQAFERALEDPEVRRRIVGVGAEPVGSTTEEFASFLAGELGKWRRLVEENQRQTGAPPRQG